MSEPHTPKGPFCQSCGMPFTKAEDFGTTAEGFRQNDYCQFCFSDGKFLEPESTLDEMINQVVPRTVAATGMKAATVRYLTELTLPLLKRWRA